MGTLQRFTAFQRFTTFQRCISDFYIPDIQDLRNWIFAFRIHLLNSSIRRAVSVEGCTAGYSVAQSVSRLTITFISELFEPCEPYEPWESCEPCDL